MGQSNLRVVENSSMDKNKALDAALSQIERAFGKGSIMRLGAASSAFPLSILDDLCPMAPLRPADPDSANACLASAAAASSHNRHRPAGNHCASRITASLA